MCREMNACMRHWAMDGDVRVDADEVMALINLRNPSKRTITSFTSLHSLPTTPYLIHFTHTVFRHSHVLQLHNFHARPDHIAMSDLRPVRQTIVPQRFSPYNKHHSKPYSEHHSQPTAVGTPSQQWMCLALKAIENRHRLIASIEQTPTDGEVTRYQLNHLTSTSSQPSMG